MRLLYYVLFLSGTAFAQVPTGYGPTKPISRRDSVPFSHQMPTVWPQNEFYRRPGDNPDVMRATLDNMPILMSDILSVRMPIRGSQSRRKKN